MFEPRSGEVSIELDLTRILSSKERNILQVAPWSQYHPRKRVGQALTTELMD